MDPTHFNRLAITVGQRITGRSALSLLAALGLTEPVSRDVCWHQDVGLFLFCGPSHIRGPRASH